MVSVVDSGVCFSAIAFGGIPLKAAQIAFSIGDVAYCSQIEFEIRKTLVAKRKWNASAADEAILTLFESALRFEIRGDLNTHCRDPKDNMVIECAVVSNASFIISGDKDLTEMKEFRGIQIVTAREFLDRFAFSKPN